MDVVSIIVLIGFIGGCLLPAMTGAAYRPDDWYERLAKPSWRPPNWVFPPAWAFLYLTIAVSGWLIWRKFGFAEAVLPLAIYLVQLVLNAGWSPIFFGMRRPDLAFVEIVILWCSIVVTIAASIPSMRPLLGCCCHIWPGSLLLRRSTLPFGASIAGKSPSMERELLFRGVCT